MSAPSPGLAVLLAAFPILFLHGNYQPGFDVSLGSTSASVTLADIAVLAVVVAAVATGRREGFTRLHAGIAVWVVGAAFLALVGVSTLTPLASSRDYPFADHLVTALKYAEYGALAPALALLVRSRRDAQALFVVVAAWSVVATFWGLLQFGGAVTAFGLEPVLQRVPSFVGFEDFALLSGAAVCVSLVALLRGASGWVEQSVAWVGGVSGGLGVVLSGAIAGVLGLGLAAAGIGLVALRRRELAPRRAVAIAGVVLVVGFGTALMRAGDIGSFFRFLGVEQSQQADAGEVQSYSQRTLLAYIGLKIFLDHPLLGVGWQGSLDEAGYGPQLTAARARFPDEPLLAFPSPRHPWGVHNAYLQALSDMGIGGLVLLAAVLLTALWLAARAALRASETGLVALAWTLLVAGLANATGLVAGIPLVALLWIAAGFAAASAAEVSRAPA